MNEKELFGYLGIFVVGVVVSYLIIGNSISYQVDDSKWKLAAEGKYNCCIERMCNYCLLENRYCDCLDRLTDGRKICPECAGAFLNGEGMAGLKKEFEKVYRLDLKDEEGREEV